MPSLNRLLVLAVLSLSLYVQAAPVRDATANLDHEIMATERDVMAAPVDNSGRVRRNFEFNIREFEETEFGSEDQDSSTPEDLALRKAKPNPAPKPPKVTPPKQRSTKATPPKTTAEPPQTTRVATSKSTNIAPPPTTTKSFLSTKVTSTPGPSTTTTAPKSTSTPELSKISTITTTTTSKSSKPPTTTTKLQKTETEAETVTETETTTATEATTETGSETETETATETGSATETETATPTATACSITTAESTPTTAITARAYNYLAQLFRRDDPEFIGWHGTNSDTAAFWQSQGQLEQPVQADGLLDFLGLGPNTTTTDGTSGADTEIGPGVYVIDDQETAIDFANNNAQVNPNTTAQLCAIFAKSSANWRTAVHKAFIPENLVGDSADATQKAELEQARLEHVAQAVPGVNATEVVKFSLLDRQKLTGQLVLPALIADQFTATCFGTGDGAAPSGTSTFPDFSYNGTTLRGEWNIASETAGASDCS